MRILDTQVNKPIDKKAPKEYLSEAIRQCQTKVITCGSITDLDQLKKNLADNCVPFETCEMDGSAYGDFLEPRRKRMARKIKQYDYGL